MEPAVELAAKLDSLGAAVSRIANLTSRLLGVKPPPELEGLLARLAEAAEPLAVACTATAEYMKAHPDWADPR